MTCCSFLNIKVWNLFSLPAPYVIKEGIRYLRGTNNLVSEKIGIVVKDKYGYK